ncbi:MAG: hypothetical protein ACRCRW_09485 [Aeromonadaceae bacterium]
MNKLVGAAALLLALVTGSAVAGTAQEIEYGVVQDTRIFTPSVSAATATSQAKHPGLRTLGAAALGGALGHQVGGGTGKDVATAVGAVAGAAAMKHRQAAATSAATPTAAAQQMIELTVKTDAGKLLSIVQPNKPDVAFAKGGKVKILTSGSDTHVEKAQ